MNAVDLIRRMWEHAAWADQLLLDALKAAADTTAGAGNPAADATAATACASALTIAWREYAHVLGAEAVWLSRLEERPSPVPVWPELTPDETTALGDDNVRGYERYLASVHEAQLHEPVEYRNSAGQAFRTAPYDVLLQVMLHGQYHRGKINLLLRQAGAEPAPADYISFVRGVPAAVTPLDPSRRAGS